MSDVHCAGRNSSYPSIFFRYNRSQIVVAFSEVDISQFEWRYFLDPDVSSGSKLVIFQTDGNPTMVTVAVSLRSCEWEERFVGGLPVGKRRALSWVIVNHKLGFRSHMRLSYSRSMEAGCAAATAGDSEESRLLVTGFEKKEASVALEWFCSEVERIRIELLLLWIEKFEFNGMSRIWIRPGCGKVRKKIGATTIRCKKNVNTS